MKSCLFIFLTALLYTSASAQVIVKKDPEIDAMIKEINTDSLKANMYKLVSFGTRNTLSTQGSSTRGIGAARQWILSRFNDYAKQSAGRLTAFIDTVTYLPDGKRVNRPIILGNVVATLKGTDPNDHRIFIMSGHMDNMRTNVMDSIGDAPGADDDGSGTVAVMECARVMSKHAFPATIILSQLQEKNKDCWGLIIWPRKLRKKIGLLKLF